VAYRLLRSTGKRLPKEITNGIAKDGMYRRAGLKWLQLSGGILRHTPINTVENGFRGPGFAALTRLTNDAQRSPNNLDADEEYHRSTLCLESLRVPSQEERERPKDDK
jgi:hypothetical protein